MNEVNGDGPPTATSSVEPDPHIPEPRTAEGAGAPKADPTVEARVAALESRLELRGAEVDALQVEAAKKTRPFYREPTTILAALALVVSVLAMVLSSTFSQVQGEQQRAAQQQQARARLTGLVQDINDVLADGLDISLVRSDLDEAGALIEFLEHTPFESTVYDKMQVTRGYTGSNEPGIAARFAREAEVQARDRTLSERVVSARFLGSALFETGDRDGGRAAYQRALDAVTNATSGYYGPISAQYRMEINQDWTIAELNSGECVRATQRVVDVQLAIGEFPPSIRRNRVGIGNDLLAQVQEACAPAP